jgi:hypothetical protein
MAKKKANEDGGGYKPHAGEAAAEGVIHGGTLGFYDEYDALGDLAPYKVDSMGNVTRSYPEGTPVKDLAKLYVERRDYNRAKQEELLNQQPGAYIGGNLVGGAVASLATPVGPIADLAINAIGMSDADLTEGDVVGAAKDIATDVALGKVAEKGLKAGMAGATAAANSRAAKRLKAIGGERLAQLRAAVQPAINKADDVIGRGKQRIEDIIDKDSPGRFDLDDKAGRLGRERTEIMEEVELPSSSSDIPAQKSRFDKILEFFKKKKK